MLKTMGHQATEEMLQKMIRVRLTKRQIQKTKTNTMDQQATEEMLQKMIRVRLTKRQIQKTKTNTMDQQATEEMLQKIIITIHRNIAPSLAQP